MERTKPSLTFILIALLLGGGFTAGSARAGNGLFDETEVALPVAKRQTVLTGFFLGNPMAEIAAVRVDDRGERRLEIHEFGGGAWSRVRETTLRPGVLFVDVARIGDTDRLLTYEEGRVSWVDPASASERLLVEATSSFHPPWPDDVPHVDMSHDLNGDGAADLVLPDKNGFWVFIQAQGGTFADPVQIGPPPDLDRITGADGYRYDPWSQSRVFGVDYNRDGRGDLLYWNGDRFAVHVQNARGLFESEARTFSTEVEFDSADLSILAEQRAGRVLHSVTDLNGDGTGDLVLATLDGPGPLRKRSSYVVHLGETSPSGGTVFPTDAAATLAAPGRVHVALDQHDFNHDGRTDLMLTTIQRRYLKGSPWKAIKGAMGDDIWLDLEFYRLDAPGVSTTPNRAHRIALDGSPSHRESMWVPLGVVLRGGTHARRRTHKRHYPRAFNRTLLIGDINGDGHDDLLVEVTHHGLDIYLGTAGPSLFGSRAQPLRVPLPPDGEYVWLTDLNDDGKQDIVMHHPVSARDPHGAPLNPPGTEPHRLTVLIAR